MNKENRAKWKWHDSIYYQTVDKSFLTSKCHPFDGFKITIYPFCYKDGYYLKLYYCPPGSTLCYYQEEVFDIGEVNFPNTKTLSGAKRKARAIIKKELISAFQKQQEKFDFIMNKLYGQ